MLSAIYGRVIALRNALYDRGAFKTRNLGARTISIGNITTGGTGKTPLVAYVATLLAERGEKVCILTRGYGRKNSKSRVLVSDGDTVLADSSTGGDEPVELGHKLIGKAVIIADPNRAAAAQWAIEKFRITRFVLDDGFQHRKVERDIDIVCIDATDPFGGGRLLPAGRLRESVAGLRRADAFVITRANLASNVAELKSQLATVAPNTPIFEARSENARLRPLNPNGQSSAAPAGKAHVFCAIGNPKALLRQLSADSVFSETADFYPDHHSYVQDDVARQERLARSSGSEFLLTTAKDAVKLSKLKFEMPCYVVEVDLELDNPEAFASLL